MKTKTLVKLLSIVLVFVMMLSLTSFDGDISSDNTEISTTYDLLEEALTDDGWMNYFSASFTSQAFEFVYNNNAKLREFFTRADCASVALNVYETGIYNDFKNSNYAIVDNYREVFLFEILSSDIMINLYTSVQLQKYNELCRMLLERLNGETEKNDVTRQRVCSEPGCEDITVPHTHENLILFYNNAIRAFHFNKVFTDEEINELNEFVDEKLLEQNKTAVRLAPPTYAYNCHSYAWYQQSTTNNFWINNEEDVELIIEDEHCVQVSEPSVGDIVVYRTSFGTILHSGVVVGFQNEEPLIVSKWAQRGLYQHTVTNAWDNYYKASWGDTYTYYRYNKTHSLMYISYDSYHTIICSKNCGYYYNDLHTYTLSSNNSNTHIYYCYTCGHTMTESHDMASFSDSLGSGVTCRDCGYVQYQHYHEYIGWEMYSETLHRRMCSECYYMEDEEHTFNIYHGNCEKCGYAGPSILKEDEETYIE